MLNSKGDHYCYLNRAPNGQAPAFESRLIQLLRQQGQAKAPPKQWAAMIRALSQKGVKAAELDDSKILSRLEANEAKSLTKEEVGAIVSHGLPTIKEIELSAVHYRSYAHQGGRYKELLYVVNSARDNVEDEICEIEMQMQELQLDASSLVIDLAGLMDDPELPDRMHTRMKALHASLPVSWSYENMPHFKDALAPDDKNVMAHARITERGPLFFVEEIQSDWAQGIGRELRNNVRLAVASCISGQIGRIILPNDELIKKLLRGEAIEIDGRQFDPKDAALKAAAEQGRSRTNRFEHVPYVNNTEAWAGLVLRRLMQRAAGDPEVEQFAWITEAMRNGGRSGGGSSLAQFYQVILPKIVDKIIKPAGGKVEMGEVVLKAGTSSQAPQFKMTPAVREVLRGNMPLYSLSPCWAGARNTPADVNRVLAECELMMGTIRHVRMLDKLVDIATGNQIAGKYVNNGIMLSLRAKDLDRAARHEAWHFAVDTMLTEAEKARIERAFSAGTPVAVRTRTTLIAMGELAAAHQCGDAGECAAHAFALWAQNDLEIGESEPLGVFESVWAVFKDLGRWISQVVTGEMLQTPEKIFESLGSGALAKLRGSGDRPTTSFRELDIEHEAPRETMRG